jgi:hypothetical protein
MILKSETYHFHRLDLTRQAGFIVTIYDEDGLRLASTQPMPTPAQAFEEARKIVDNKIEGPKKLKVPSGHKKSETANRGDNRRSRTSR